MVRREALKNSAVLTVHRQQPGPSPGRHPPDNITGGDQDLLSRDRNIHASTDGRQHRPQSGNAHHRADNKVSLNGLDKTVHSGSTTVDHNTWRCFPATVLRRVGVRHRYVPNPKLLRLFEHPAIVAIHRQSNDAEPSWQTRYHPERVLADGPCTAEYDDALAHEMALATK
jgi:hypothetical protein